MLKVALVASALALALVPGQLMAQGTAQSGPQNPAVKTNSGNNTNMPVKGANSFTMSEAQSRVTSHGYTQVSALKKDSNGVWRGMASKDGQRVHVSLDYQGNVNAE